MEVAHTTGHRTLPSVECFTSLSLLTSFSVIQPTRSCPPPHFYICQTVECVANEQIFCILSPPLLTLPFVHRTGAQKPEKEIQGEIQAIIRQITASVTFLPLLQESCMLW